MSIFARRMHLHVNKSSPIFPLFFFELKPQIEKKRSMHAQDDLILINSLANLLNNLIAFLIQNDLVELIVVTILKLLEDINF